ncbi:hypothetical protein NQ317_012032 [Molorchus minor]|uniref:Cytochrome P450 n=1 Tax=Molorchus minor TaxID=1323400 RepID=A0ABQ9J0A1_9CUCU|nr:hypothetical protein NQ317_012032 [Molorchus minor]
MTIRNPLRESFSTGILQYYALGNELWRRHRAICTKTNAAAVRFFGESTVTADSKYPTTICEMTATVIKNGGM